MAVLIATRHSSHAQLIFDALEAGKHVLVEKPMAITVRDAERVLEMVRDTQLILRVGFNRRFSGHHQLLKEVLGPAGQRILSIRVNAGDIGGHWSTSGEEGGRLIGEGVHFFDLANWMFGSEPIAITAVAAGKPELSNPNFSVALTYGDAGCAQILYTSLGSPRMGKEYFEVFAPGQSAVCRDYIDLSIYPRRKSKHRLVKGDKGQREMMREFAGAIRGEQHSVAGADAAAGLAATRIAVSCYDAARRQVKK